MAIPIGILAERMRRSSEPDGAALLVLIALVPLIGPGLAQVTSLQAMPFALAALCVLCWRTLAQERRARPIAELRLAVA
jgi:hypothetical protein